MDESLKKKKIKLQFSANGITWLTVLQNISLFPKTDCGENLSLPCTKSSSLQYKNLQCLPSEKFFIGINNWGWRHHCNLSAFTEGKPEMYIFPHHKAISLTSLSFKHWQLRPTTATCNLCMRFSKLACIPKDISETSVYKWTWYFLKNKPVK